MGAPRRAAATASPRRALAEVLERVSESVEKRGSLGRGGSEGFVSGEWKAETDLTLLLAGTAGVLSSLALLARRGREKLTMGFREASGLSVAAVAMVVIVVVVPFSLLIQIYSTTHPVSTTDLSSFTGKSYRNGIAVPSYTLSSCWK